MLLRALISSNTRIKRVCSGTISVMPLQLWFCSRFAQLFDLSGVARRLVTFPCLPKGK
jgi:hypothetical protein